MARNPDRGRRAVDPSEAGQTAASAREAAAIVGRTGDEERDPAERPLAEAGEAMAQGFELAGEGLIEAAEHADRPNDSPLGAFTARVDGGTPRGIIAEADHG